MNPLLQSSAALTALLPHYLGSDDRAKYFRGTMAKAADSLTAIHDLQEKGALWPVHCRWVVEAFAICSALNADPATLDSIKKESANTFLNLADVGDAERKKILSSMPGTRLPTADKLLSATEERLGAKNGGLLYKAFRMLCEYTHYEFQRTVSYPLLGPEAPEILAKRKTLLTSITIACAQTLPVFAHCPPTCGFDDAGHAILTELCDCGWKVVAGLDLT